MNSFSIRVQVNVDVYRSVAIVTQGAIDVRGSCNCRMEHGKRILLGPNVDQGSLSSICVNLRHFSGNKSRL